MNNKQKRWMSLLAVCTMSAMLFTGCATQADAHGQAVQLQSNQAAEQKIEKQTAQQPAKPVEKKVEQKPAKQIEKQTANIITLEQAKEIALQHAGVKASDARFENGELDKDDGVLLYELEFTANDMEYDYEVHAESGKVLKAEKEYDDDQYDNDRYDDDRYDDDYDDRYDDDRYDRRD